MSERNFDPMTGQPINQAYPGSYKFDPMTGQPINQTQTEGAKFDPMTGQPVNQQANVQSTYSEQYQTGPQLSFGAPDYSMQQSFGEQQPAAYGYDPAAIEREQSEKNKKLAFAVLGFAGVMFFGLLIVGGIQVKNLVKRSLAERNEDVVENTIDDGDIFPETEWDEEPDTTVEYEEPVISTENEETDIAETPADEPAEEVKEKAVATKPSEPREGIDPDNMYAFTFDGVTYQLPEKVSDFMEDGWTFNSEKEETQLLSAGGTEYFSLFLPGDENIRISVDLTNFSLDAKEAKDCYVTEMTFSEYVVDQSGKQITVKDGRATLMESTSAEVLDAFGEPDRTTPDTYYYYDPSHDEYDTGGGYVACSISEDDIFEMITICNDNAPADVEQVEVSTDVPAYLNDYVAPKSLGDDPLSGNFELDGVVYNLPVPLQVFQDNGWKCDVDENYTVGAGQGYVINIEKGSLAVCVVTYNWSDKANIIKNTIVTSVGVDPDGLYGNGMKFPAGLSCDMTEAELLDFIKDNGITNYDYSKDTGFYTIPFDQTGNDRTQSANRYEILTHDGKVVSIDVRSYGWLPQ
ncbi:hypothetical protein [Butyrivibrio sp. VCD2006]|uniref:hypothetical protein n=1 Tax=Butyrivibrio sp. VCD2006 TaxID=1280664 RepID=UPI000417A055|nr:hypothetical protein [Butyrivibrio sp. VCD2006]